MNALHFRPLLLAALLPWIVASPALATSVTVIPSSDAFVTGGSADSNAGSPTLNYGAAGALMVSAPGSTEGEIQTLLKFNLSTVKSTFDVMYGAGNWMVDSITLQLGTNFGTQGVQPNNAIFNKVNGGLFSINWQANDNWGEGSGTPALPFTPINAPVDAVTFASLGSLEGVADRSLGTFTYTPVGNTNPPTIPEASYTLGMDASFLADVAAGGDVSMRAFAADTGVNYLFNARTFGTASTRPMLTIDAVATPEPGTATLLAGAALLGFCGRRRHARMA